METSTSVTVDVVELGILYRDLPSYQPEPAGDFAGTRETKAALPSMEPIAFPSESASEMTVVSMMLQF